MLTWTELAERLTEGGVAIEHQIPLSLSRQGVETELGGHLKSAGFQGQTIISADEDGGEFTYYLYNPERVTPDEARASALALAEKRRSKT